MATIQAKIGKNGVWHAGLLDGNDRVSVYGEDIVCNENLVLNSNNKTSNNDYSLIQTMCSRVLEIGKTYTITLCVSPAKNVTSYGIYLSQGYTGLGSVSTDKTTNMQILSKTFTVTSFYTGRTPTENVKNGYPQVYRFPNDGTVTTNSTLHWIKVEEGSVATPWIPAPGELKLGSTMSIDNPVEANQFYEF